MSSLKKYYRKPKAFIQLPTQGLLYDLQEDGSMMGEVGVMPMTMLNHLTANNPESLINGHVLEELVRDCTTIQNVEARNMYKCDIDALVMGIRMVSVDDTLDVSVSCPKCEKETDFGIDLKGMLAEMSVHETIPYDLEVEELVLKIVPTTLNSSINTEQAFFQDAKNIDQIRTMMEELRKDDDVSDEDVMEKVKSIYEIQHNMTETTIQLYADAILYVATPEENVYDRKEIYELVKGLSDSDHTRLKDKVRQVSEIGIPRKQSFTCSHCEHKYDAPVELNPTDFFGNGSQ